MMPVFSFCEMAPVGISSPQHCKTGTKSRKTVIPSCTGLPPVRGVPYSPWHCMIPNERRHLMPYIYVIGMDGKPQMPTKRRRHVQKLLDTGKARITERVPFTIQLLYDNDPVLQPVILAEDPGRTNIGVATLDLKGNLLLSAAVETRNKEIAKLMEKRRQCRRASRNGERKARQRLAKKYGTMIQAGMRMRKLPQYAADACFLSSTFP